MLNFVFCFFVKSFSQHLGKEFQSLSFCPQFSNSNLFVPRTIIVDFTLLHSISPFWTDKIALITDLKLFGINWHVLTQSKYRNCCLYIIMNAMPLYNLAITSQGQKQYYYCFQCKIHYWVLEVAFVPDSNNVCQVPINIVCIMWSSQKKN